MSRAAVVVVIDAGEGAPPDIETAFQLGKVGLRMRLGPAQPGLRPPAPLYYAWRDRRRESPARHLCGLTGILKADNHRGFNEFYHPSLPRGRSQRHSVGPIPDGSSSSSRTRGEYLPRQEKERRSPWRRLGGLLEIQPGHRRSECRKPGRIPQRAAFLCHECHL